MPEWSGFRKKKDGPQQGTLFDVREVPSEPVDSPGMRKRGRREEMLAAVPRTKVFSADSRHGEVREKIAERGRVAEMYPENPQVAETNVATDRAGKARRAEIARDLADRTTVHPDTLRGLAQISEGQYYSLVNEGFRPEFGPHVAAHYDQFRHANGPVIEAPHKMDVGTLTHEIGHHESRYHNRNTSTGETYAHLRSGTHVGVGEEGRADAYALEHAPQDRTYTYASNAKGTEDEPKFAGIQSPYRREREAMGQPLRDWEGGAPNVGQQFAPHQEEIFEVEDAFAPDADAEVQAYTQNEGREVLGWGPNRYHDPESIHKHEYDPEGEKPFWGANYVSMFNDDVVPDRWINAIGGRRKVKQVWKSR